jgi:hypothetical protein
MVRTSQCFHMEFSQPDGPPTHAAAEVLPYLLVPRASVVKTDRGVNPLDLSLGHKWHFLVRGFRSTCMDACQFICSALWFYQFRRLCAPLLGPLLAFVKLLCKASRKSKFRPRTQGRKSAAPSVTAR